MLALGSSFRGFSQPVRRVALHPQVDHPPDGTLDGTAADRQLGTSSGRALHAAMLQAMRAELVQPSPLIAFASRSFATISSGLCFFRRLFVIESLLATRAVDLHIDWIRISKPGQPPNLMDSPSAGRPLRKCH